MKLTNNKLLEDITMAKDFYSALQERRSIYALTNESPISNERIVEVVEYAVQHTPSAFNSQNSRAVVLIGEQHQKLWNKITKDALRSVVPAEAFAAT
jgi:predicted oxidoreductase (fatty acid repression mutant protein)